MGFGTQPYYEAFGELTAKLYKVLQLTVSEAVSLSVVPGIWKGEGWESQQIH